MITKISASGLKGLNFTYDLQRFNLLAGANGAGKSAVIHALELAILGYIPSNGDKQPGSIFASHAKAGDDKFSVGFNLDDHTFARTFKADGQIVFQNKRKLPNRDVSRALLEIGNPVIFDVKSFMDLSDARKIDWLFNIFPPPKNVDDLESQIETKTERLKVLNEKLRGYRQLIETITTERAKIPIPSGTLPEIKAEIEQKEKDIADAQGLLNEIEAQEREAAAAEKAKKKAEDKAAADAKKEKEKAEAEQRERDEIALKNIREIQEKLNNVTEKDVEKALESLEEQGLISVDDEKITLNKAPEQRTTFGDHPLPLTPYGELLREVVWDFWAVLQTMKQAGCENCATIIFLKTLIQKWKDK